MRGKPAFILLLGLLLIPALLLASATASAQVVSQREKAEKEIQQRKDLEQKTLVLLDEIIASAGTFKLPENRSLILASAANLLWQHDEKRARNLYWEALNNLTLMANTSVKSAATNKPGNAKAQIQHFYETFGLRRDLLHKVAKYDPQFALELLQAARLQTVEPPKSDMETNSELQLEQEIAGAVAVKDPKRALQIARESLAKGVSFEVLNLLQRLNAQDSDIAAKFAGEVVDKLRSENFANGTAGAVVAVQLLLYSRMPKEVPAQKLESTKLESAPMSSRWKPIPLDDNQRRDLLEMIMNSSTSVSTNHFFLSTLAEIMPEIEQFAPERLPALRRQQEEFNRTINAEEKGWNEHNSLVVSGSPEEMLKAAARATGDLRQSLEREAIIKASMSGNPDSLREFISDQIEDEGRRKSLIDSLDAELIGAAAYKGNLEELEKLLPRIRLKEQRARAMANIAILMEARGQHDNALNLLDEARLLVKTDLESETKTEALLALILAYALVEPSKSFAIVERTIDKANDQLALALLANKFIKQNGFLKKGEIVLAHSGSMPTDFLLFQYGKGVIALAKADFNRTKAAADRLQRNELRVLARLLLVQAILHPQAQPNEF